MRAASRPQRRGRGRETPAARRGSRPARRRDRGAGVLRGVAPVRDRRPGLGRHHADGARRISCVSACGPRRPTPRAAARTCACSPVPFARAVDALCTAEEPAAADRVVPLSPHQVNCRVQVLADVIGLEGGVVALRTPGLGVGARPPRRLDHRRAARRRLAQRLDGRPLRLGRRRRGRRRRQALRTELNVAHSYRCRSHLQPSRDRTRLG